jgi:hypothetical protein
MAAALFILGCATGGTASRMVSPARAQGPQHNGGRAWQYLCIKDANVPNLQAQSNQLGAQGWEMTASALSGTSSFADPIWCFKR